MTIKKESNTNKIMNIKFSEIRRITCRSDLYNLQTKKTTEQKTLHFNCSI